MSKKFGIYIVVIFTGLLIITVSGIISIIYFQSKSAAMEDAKNRFRSSSSTVTEKTWNYLNTAELLTEQATQVFNSPDIKLQLESDESRYLLKALSTYKQIDLFYYGNEKGDYLQAADFADLYAKVIHRKENRAYTIFHYYTPDGKRIIKTKTVEDSGYDPRKRPWYIGAKETKKTFWTEPYIFFETKQPGITVAIPIFRPDGKTEGVVAADITLKGLSDFLHNLGLQESTFAFISDKKGKLIAFSGDKPIVCMDANKIRSITIEELGIPVMTQAEKNLKKQSKNFISFSQNGRIFYANRFSLHEKIGKKWYFTIIAPEDNFTGALNGTLTRILIFSIAGLIVGTILTMLLAQRISKPIELLSEDIMRVRNLDLDSSIAINSHIHEIQTMDNAIQAMKTSLKAFRLYVPEVLVKKLISSGESIEIGGKEREISILFSDIKDFTQIAEKIPPQELIQQLSEYFDAMTVTIEDNAGTVDKFIGDAVMAFWGAPLKSKNHAWDACQSALECQRKLTKLNASWKSEGKSEFHTRIGIHTDSVTVGNMGAKRRLNYTAIGDGVNLASRLEGVNKIYKTKIIISHETYTVVKDLFICRILDEISVKGKNRSIKIYELLTEKQSSDAENYAKFADMFFEIYNIYLNREWQKALKLLKKYNREYPDDYLCQIYTERCREYIEKEPPSSWDGVIKFDAK